MTSERASGGDAAARPLPSLSVVLVTPDEVATLERTLAHLAAQADADALEIVVVGPREIGDDAEVAATVGDGFGAVRRVALDRFLSIGAAYAAGVRAATSDVVALAEDHCFPAPGWSTALRRRHLESWSVVGPAVHNANPATMTSRADFVIGYGPWMAPHPGGRAPFVPGHNSSYKRATLLERDVRLDTLLEAETVLHYELAAAGHGLAIEPEATVAHTNYSLMSAWLRAMFHNGRAFAANRVEGWSTARRVAYAGASPLIPPLRFVRALREIWRRPTLRRPYARAGGALALGLLCDGIGQGWGALTGRGRSIERLAALETRRVDKITAADRRELFGSDAPVPTSSVQPISSRAVR